jgi:LPXTG-motif cell wall-anchored protein
MKHLALLAACTGMLAFTLAPSARADEWDKKTIITVNQPFQVPHMVLPAGTYVMKLLDSPSDRHIVQIFNKDENHLYTTILAIPNYRLEPTGKTVITFWETPPGQPKAVRAWFYPGDLYGQEFAYPKSTATQIAAVSHAPVPTTEAEKPAELPQAPVTTTQPPAEVAQNTPPPPAPAPAPVEAAPAPALAPVPEELPKTGSPYLLIALAGLSSLGIFGLLRAIRSQ